MAHDSNDDAPLRAPAERRQAAIYVRSVGERVHALQFRACMEYARRHALAVRSDRAFIEADDATEQIVLRPSFARMYQQIVLGAFEILLVDSPDALFHSREDFEDFVRTLPQYGVELVIVSAE